jgi:hypothetical protein
MVGSFLFARIKLLSRALHPRCAGARLPGSVGLPPWASPMTWCAVPATRGTVKLTLIMIYFASTNTRCGGHVR